MEYDNLSEAEKIKISLLQKISNYHKKDYIAVPEVTIINKIVDLLVVNGDIHIYEIKSKADSLKRLPEQIDTFKKYANKVTVVADSKFIPTLLKKDYMQDIGIIEVNDAYKLQLIKKPTKRKIDAPHHLAYLNIYEIRETLRGFDKWYKMNLIEAEAKMIALLNQSELRKVGLFRIKEKFKIESLSRMKYLKQQEYKNAVTPRYETNYLSFTTPLKSMPKNICRNLSN